MASPPSWAFIGAVYAIWLGLAPAAAQTSQSTLDSQINAVSNAYQDEDADKLAHQQKAEAQQDEQTDMALEEQRIQLGEQKTQLQSDQIAVNRENDMIDHALKQEDAGTSVLNAQAGAITNIGKAIGDGKITPVPEHRQHRSSGTNDDDDEDESF